MSTIERRSHQRQIADSFTVAERIGGNGDAYLPRAGFMRDVSAGGLFFYAQERMEQGDRVFLTIYPNTGWAKNPAPPKLAVTGKVLRIEKAPEAPTRSEMCGVAIEFDKEPEVVLEEHDIASIILLLSHLPSRAPIHHIRKRASGSEK
jgi:Tfp pilus assembly protein PilZ